MINQLTKQKNNEGNRALSLAVLAVVLAFLAVLAATPFLRTHAAAAYTPKAASFSVSQAFDGTVSPEKQSYRLAPVEEGNPMPDGASGTAYVFTLNGSSAEDKLSLTFTQPGVYQYTLTRVDSDGNAVRSESPSEPYRFGFSVKNGPDGTLVITSFTCTNGEITYVDGDMVLSFVIAGTKTTTPGTTGTSGTTTHTGSRVNTNDPSNIWFWAEILAASALCLILLILLDRKRRKRDGMHEETH